MAQILKGVTLAQKQKNGEHIAAEGIHGKISDHLFIERHVGAFTVMDFDVSVVAETKGGGKGRVKVFGIGEASGGLDRGVQNTNRVRFAVNLKLPTGAKEPPRERPDVTPDNSWVV